MNDYIIYVFIFYSFIHSFLYHKNLSDQLGSGAWVTLPPQPHVTLARLAKFSPVIHQEEDKIQQEGPQFVKSSLNQSGQFNKSTINPRVSGKKSVNQRKSRKLTVKICMFR